ncbi:MAG: hypothetical protein ABGX64_05670 [Cycloclasticus sp.]|jgi:hypothetical protein
MNKHSKLALLLAPFLIIGGYIASDQYIAYNDNKTRIFTLLVSSECDIFKRGCILESGNMQINITHNKGITKANTSFPVDSVLISHLHVDGNETIYSLNKAGSFQYWERETDLGNAISNDLNYTLRVVIKQKGRVYLCELNV